MAEKILNTRVILKHDTLANWNNEAALVLKEGEVALAKVEQNKVDPISGQLVKVPTYLIKVGDGTSKFSALNWVAAPAADVHDWAKKSETEFTTWVKGLIDVTDIDAYSKGEADEKFVAKEADKSLVADTEIERLSNMSDGANNVKSSSTNGNIEIDGVETVVYTHPEKHAIDDVDGLADAIADAVDEAKEYADGKVASVAAGDASVTVGGTATAPTVAAKLSADADNALTLAADGLKVVIPAAAEYSIVKAADSGDYAAVYNLTKDGTIVGASINIPKDMVVKSGSVIGEEIVLVLNDEASTEIKIPVSSLIEYVTSGSQTGDMVVVNVSDDHKVTATITDGTVTLAKLTTEVQTAIGKAHNHENADVLAGITAGQVAGWDDADEKAHEHKNLDLLETYTQTEENLADAVAKKHEHANKIELDKFVDGDKAKLDTAVQTVAANDTDAKHSGLKATRTNNDIAIEIDDTITWVFDCGGSGVTA